MISLVLAASLALARAPSPTPSPDPSLTYEAGVTHDTLTAGRPAWDSQYLRVTQRTARQQTFYAQFETASRFNRQDERFTLGAYLPLAAQWEVIAEGSASGTHDFLPASSVMAGIQYASGGGWFEGISARTTAYDAASVNSGAFSIERYWKDYRAYYALTAARLAASGTDVEQAVEFDRYYGKGEVSYVGIGYLTGREIDDLGLPVLLVSHVDGWNVAGRQWMDGNWAIVYGFGTFAQGSLYSRTGEHLGIEYRF